MVLSGCSARKEPRQILCGVLCSEVTLCWHRRELSVVTGGFGFVPTFRRFLPTFRHRTNFEVRKLPVWGQGFVGERTSCTPEPPRLCFKCVVGWQSQVSCQHLEAVHCGLLKGCVACCNGRRWISNGTWLLSIAEQKSALELVCRIDGLLSPSRILEEEFNWRNRAFLSVGRTRRRWRRAFLAHLSEC